MASPTTELFSKVLISPWIIYTDGPCNKVGSRIGYLIVSLDGKKVERSIRIKFNASNNEAEYKAAIYTLRVAMNLGAMRVQLFTNLKLVAS